jgi:hypothetical protein
MHLSAVRQTGNLIELGEYCRLSNKVELDAMVCLFSFACRDLARFRFVHCKGVAEQRPVLRRMARSHDTIFGWWVCLVFWGHPRLGRLPDNSFGRRKY